MEVAVPFAPVRILHVIESFGAGSMQVAITISRGLATAGHSVAIAHGRVGESPADARAAVGEGIELFSVPWGRSPRNQARAGRRLREIATAWRPEAIHLHSSYAGLGCLALRPTAPLIYTPHGYSFIREARNPLVPLALRAAEAIVAARVDVVATVSDYEARLARSVGARSVVTIRNGLPELDVPAQLPEPAEPPEVVAVGRLHPARRPLDAGAILAGLRDVAQVEWIGGPAEGEVADRLRGLGVPVSGWRPRSAVLARLARATACLHWSAWDSQSLAVLEAMSQDAVVIASDIPANRELLGDDQVCRDAEDALRLLRRVIGDPRFRAERLAHQRAVRDRHSAREMVSRWIDLYGEVARRPRRRLLARRNWGSGGSSSIGS